LAKLSQSVLSGLARFRHAGVDAPLRRLARRVRVLAEWPQALLGKYNVALAMIGSFTFGARALERTLADSAETCRKLAKEKF
jgi:hypothetical protein